MFAAKETREIVHAHCLTKSIVKSEVKNAVRVLQKYANKDKNNSLAQFYLAECYRDGLNVSNNVWKGSSIILKKNTNKMIELYIKATIGGNSNARYRLAECCEVGFVIKKDIEKAIYLYSADDDSYSSFNGLDKFKSLKIHELSESDSKLNSSGELNNFENYESDYESESESDYGSESESESEPESESESNLELNKYEKIIDAMIEHQNENEDLNEDIERTMFVDEKKNNSKFCLKCCLAEFYEMEDEDGNKRNQKKAIELFTLSSNSGCLFAQTALGMRYEDGNGVEQDLELAAKLYSRSAKKGDLDALNSLALCYINGNGVEKNLKIAEDLLKMAVEQGHVEAKHNLDLLINKTKA